MQLYKKAKKTLHNYFIYARPENRRREENTESQLTESSLSLERSLVANIPAARKLPCFHRRRRNCQQINTIGLPSGSAVSGPGYEMQKIANR